MRAIWYDRQGSANEVIVRGELPTPEPGTGEVRVRLEASGVNPSDTYRRRGAVPAEYPRVIPNSDGAGVVDKVGAMVPERWVGKRVWLYNGQRNGRWMGTAAEYICLNADLVTELPSHVSFAEAATLGIPGMTAHGCVFAAGMLQGRIVLVTGGAGAVGHYAVQLAAWAGASVIATVSSDEKAARACASSSRLGPISWSFQVTPFAFCGAVFAELMFVHEYLCHVMPPNRSLERDVREVWLNSCISFGMRNLHQASEREPAKLVWLIFRNGYAAHFKIPPFSVGSSLSIDDLTSALLGRPLFWRITLVILSTPDGKAESDTISRVFNALSRCTDMQLLILQNGIWTSFEELLELSTNLLSMR